MTQEYPKTMQEFAERFPTETACRDYTGVSTLENVVRMFPVWKYGEMEYSPQDIEMYAMPP